MAIYGRALRDSRRDEVASARPCARPGCAHRCDLHREMPYGSPGYEPLRFVCAECDCPGFVAGAA